VLIGQLFNKNLVFGKWAPKNLQYTSKIIKSIIIVKIVQLSLEELLCTPSLYAPLAVLQMRIYTVVLERGHKTKVSSARGYLTRAL
jgi:hypothetical protein